MNEYGNYLRRVDLVKNQVEREKIREQHAATARSKSIQQQNAKRFADYQRVLRAELAERWFSGVLSTGGTVGGGEDIPNNYIDDGYIDNYFE